MTLLPISNKQVLAGYYKAIKIVENTFTSKELEATTRYVLIMHTQLHKNDLELYSDNMYNLFVARRQAILVNEHNRQK